MKRTPGSRRIVLQERRRWGALLFAIPCLLWSPAWAKAGVSVPQARLLITVVDDNGRPIAGARATLEHTEAGILRTGETDHVGRCAFLDLPAGMYRLRVEKERFYTVTVPDVRLPENEAMEIVLRRQQELVEVMEVTPSSSVLDPWQTAARVELSASEILTLPTPVMRDLRYALAMLPGVVQDPSGNLHIAGSATSQTLTTLDGFTITHPITGQLDLRVSVDAVREVSVHHSRYSAEYGRGSGGVLELSTAMGDDRFRFSATDVLPSLQHRKGIHLNNWTPRATVSGPLQKRRAWFYEAAEGEYDVAIVEELPRGADRNRAWRLGNLTKVQVNASASHLLTLTFLTHRFRSPYDGLSRFAPRETTRRVSQGADFFALKGQAYRPDGLLFEYGVGLAHFRDAEHPRGDAPYLLSPEGSGGHFFRTADHRAHRLQGILNLTLPSFFWRGRHEVKIGTEWIHVGARERVRRRPLILVRADGTPVRAVSFSPTPETRVTNVELAFYGQNRWVFASRGVVEFGLRFDWDSMHRAVRWSPRAAASYLLTADRRTKLTGGLGLFHDATPLDVVLRSQSGRRQDLFYARDGRAVEEIVEIAFRADVRALASPRAFIWSLGVERQLPAGFVLSLEVLQKRGHHGWGYLPALESEGAMPARSDPRERSAVSPAVGPLTRHQVFELRDHKRDRYDALQVTLRWNLREAHPLLASYVRSRARSNAVLDFAPDLLVWGAQAGGPLPWDTPHRFLLWGWAPLPKRFTLAYTVEWRDGYPFLVVNEAQRLVEPPNRRRLPTYFSLNLHLERRFRFLGLHWALRAGLNNVTNHPNPSTVNNNVDSPHFLTWGGMERRAFVGRLRLLGRK